MAIRKQIERQYALSGMLDVVYSDQGSGNGASVSVPPGTLVLRASVAVVTAFNGTTTTLTLSDGTENLIAAQSVATGGAVASNNIGNYYPAGGVLTATLSSANNTAGRAFVTVEYVQENRHNEPYTT